MKKIFQTFRILIYLTIIFTVNVFGNDGSADINITGEHKYKSIRLMPDIYKNANADLSDILIVDEKETAVPYFINSFHDTTKVSALLYPLVMVDSFVKEQDYFADYYIENSEEKDLVSTSIELDTKSYNFAKNVELSGSFDGVNWDFIKSDKLYRVDDSEKISIDFDKPLKYTYFRVKTVDNIENIVFDVATLQYNQLSVKQEFFKQTIKPKFEIKEDETEKNTMIDLLGLKNLKISEITIETDDQFKRVFTLENGISETLYNLYFQDTVYKDTKIVLDEYYQSKDVLTITINNRDDKPIAIKDITVSYFADEVVFKGENEKKYKILFGNKNTLNAPEYDIYNYKEMILNEGYDLLSLENITLPKIPVILEEMPVPDYSVHFNVVVVVISILLFFIILSKMKSSKEI